MSREIGLKGGKELMAFLDQLPKNLEKNVLRGALRAAANVVRDDARSRVDAQSGQLRRAIKTDTVTDGGRITARVKLRGKHSFLGVFMEYGVAPHFIRAGDANVATQTLNRRGKRGGVEILDNGLAKIGASTYDQRRRTKNGTEVVTLKIKGMFVRGAVQHPGFAAKPFLRPALDARADDAVRAFGNYLSERLRIGDFSAPRLELDDE